MWCVVGGGWWGGGWLYLADQDVRVTVVHVVDVAVDDITAAAPLHRSSELVVDERATLADRYPMVGHNH